MRRAIFLMLFLMAFNSYAQNRNEYKVVIDSAINIKLKTTAVQLSRQDKGMASSNDYYLIDQDNRALYYSSLTPNGINLKYMDVYNPKNKKILRKGIAAWKVIGSLNGNKFTVTIIDFKITYAKQNYDFSNGGGSMTQFQFSCKENRWLFLNQSASGL
ncbi:hypothetical protein [Niabella sp.]|uniref:hypothetical protein n=1 Tax=Niabella sp. TaxID=1962976 RepID=UPI0026029E15|nr:hypothetical protein [Niabella sp.]